MPSPFLRFGNETDLITYATIYISLPVLGKGSWVACLEQVIMWGQGAFIIGEQCHSFKLTDYHELACFGVKFGSIFHFMNIQQVTEKT